MGDPVRPGIWRLHGTDPSLPVSDLAPLKLKIGKATVVALGESVHTSGGFYEMKDRVIRYLVAQAGFRVVAWETPWFGADVLASYVESCGGDLDGALTRIFPVWVSQETRDLFVWMCDWNRAHRRSQDKVHFLGFDIQDSYGQARANAVYLRTFFSLVGILPGDERVEGLNACDGVVASDPQGGVLPERKARCLASTQALEEVLDRQGGAFARRTSKAHVALAKINLAGLRAWEEQSSSARGSAARFSARDQGMASTLLGLRALRYPNAKTIVWAHNLHVEKGNTDQVTSGTTWMGSFLAQALGKSYFTVGLGSLQTEIDWEGVGCGLVDEYGKDPSIERSLADLGQGDLFVDLHQPGLIPEVIPAGYQHLGAAEILVDREFDALIYLDRSPAMHPLAWPSCQ